MVFFLLGIISIEISIYAKNENANSSINRTQNSRNSSRFDYLYYPQHRRDLFRTTQQCGLKNLGVAAETSN